MRYFPTSEGSKDYPKETYPFDATAQRQRNNLQQWELLYSGDSSSASEEDLATSEIAITVSSKMSKDTTGLDDASQSFSKQQKTPYQLHRRYIINQINLAFGLLTNKLPMSAFCMKNTFK
ncbi:MAG: hypothetical protein HC912_02445 [Saprospiraceae bacterium]|nr:hypothetical protein [Saprospiraceae bacterium]